MQRTEDYDRALQCEHTLTIYMINDNINRLKKELESHIDKRDRSYDNAVMAKEKGVGYMYNYWQVQYRYHSDHVRKITDALSEIADEVKRIEQHMPNMEVKSYDHGNQNRQKCLHASGAWKW